MSFHDYKTTIRDGDVVILYLSSNIYAVEVQSKMNNLKGKHCKGVLECDFGEELNSIVNMVFLDLPSPWLGVAHAVAAMNTKGGRLCSLFPCIEQVQRTCLALEEHRFEDICTMEVLQMELKVSRRTVPIRDLTFLRHKSSECPVKERPRTETSYAVAALPQNSPGHTGYLTVATLTPGFRRNKG